MPCISPGSEMACYNNKSTHLTGPFLHRGQLSPRAYEEKRWPLYNLFLFLLPYNVEKENKLTAFLASYYYIMYHVKPYGSWFWHFHCMLKLFFFFPLYSANLTTAFSNTPQTFPSSLAANQISMSDHISSNRWHLFYSLVLFSSSFHNFCFSVFVHSSAFTSLALNLISSVSLLATNLY